MHRTAQQQGLLQSDPLRIQFDRGARRIDALQSMREGVAVHLGKRDDMRRGELHIERVVAEARGLGLRGRVAEQETRQHRGIEQVPSHMDHRHVADIAVF